MAQRIVTMTNANVYADGGNWVGMAAEVMVPEAPYKMVDFEGLGLIGSPELFTGIDKMEATFKWSSLYDNELMKLSNPNSVIKLQVRGNLRIENASGLVDEQAAVYFMNVKPKNMAGLNFKRHENVEIETKLAVNYLRLEVARSTKFEIDVMANIFKIGGVDIMAKYRRNLGL